MRLLDISVLFNDLIFVIALFQRKQDEVLVSEVVGEALYFSLLVSLIAQQGDLVADYFFIFAFIFGDREIRTIQLIALTEKPVHVVQIKNITVYFDAVNLIFKSGPIASSCGWLFFLLFHNGSLILYLLKKLHFVFLSQSDV